MVNLAELESRRLLSASKESRVLAQGQESTRPLMGGKGGSGETWVTATGDVADNARTLADWMRAVANNEEAQINVVNDYDLVGDGTTDNTAGLAALATDIAALAAAGDPLPTIVFPAGVYAFATWPDLAFRWVKIVALGDVTLRSTGASHGVVFDGTGKSPSVRNLVFDGFKIEVPSDAGDACQFIACHETYINVNIRGAGTTAAGLRLQFSVCPTIHIKCSVNDGGWYNDGSGSAKPAYGLYLDRTSGAEHTIGASIMTPIIEGTGIGVYMDYASNNKIFGGTLEACTDTGLHLTANSQSNEIQGVAYESNTNYDVHDLGVQNTHSGCYAFNLIQFGATARANKLQFGSYKSVTVLSSAADVSLMSFDYNRNNDGGVITDSGTRTLKFNLRNRGAATTQGRPWNRTAVGDTNYTILSSDNIINTSAVLTTPRTWTLPLAADVPAGYRIKIFDAAEGITRTNTLTIARAGSDTINGVTSFILNMTGGTAEFVSNGVSNWMADRKTFDYRPVGDATATIAATDRTVGTSAVFSASRAWTLPAASAYPPGQPLHIVDMAGGLTGVNTLVITRAGSDTINGATTFTLNAAYASAILISNGAAAWYAK